VESPDEGASVQLSRIENGGWTTPARADLSGGARKHEMEAFFGVDGDRIFFAPYSKGMDVRIWTADVTPEGFVEPHALGGPIAEDPSFYPVQAADGSLFYTNLAKQSVWQASLDDGRVTGIRDTGLDKGGHAFPSPDGAYILIDSASLGSDEQRDIFVSFRNEDGSWGAPKALGPSVNTEYSETCPSLSPDGEFLFFSRYDEPGGISDIYWISTEVIELEAPV
jgi:Tol biopolymer transport system component